MLASISDSFSLVQIFHHSFPLKQILDHAIQQKKWFSKVFLFQSFLFQIFLISQQFIFINDLSIKHLHWFLIIYLYSIMQYLKNAPFIIFNKCSFQVLIKYIYKIECPFHDGSCIIQNALRKIESFQIICDQCKYRCDFIISFNEVKRNS